MVLDYAWLLGLLPWFNAPPPPPTAVNVSYGPHARQVLDIWQPCALAPTPLVLFIHGGAWLGGDKASVSQHGLHHLLDAGIAVASINYRFINLAETCEAPVKTPLADAARALQFLRFKANDWNIDAQRIGGAGESAGGASVLWLAFHEDLANPTSADPVARHSTHLTCVAVSRAQTSLDPRELRAWIPNYNYGRHAFGFANFGALYAFRDKVLPWIKEYSPIEHVTRHAPPTFLDYPYQKGEPVPGTLQVDPTHSAILGVKLAEKLRGVGVEAILTYPGNMHPLYRTPADFLIERLRK